jgi:trk system potassium uptake protein
MNIIINGGGGVGEALADILSLEQHDITIIEKNPGRTEALEELLDCRILAGSGSSPAELLQARVDQADIFLAVTDSDEVNLLSCMLARKLGCGRNVARVKDKAYTTAEPVIALAELGIDQVIDPDEEAAREIVRLLETPGTTQVIPLAGGAVISAGMTVPGASPLAGQTLSQLHASHPQWRYRVVIIRRGNEGIIPSGRDHIEPWDELFVVAQPETIREMARLFSATPRTEDKLDRVMILGASDLGRHVANLLEDQARVTLIDPQGHHAEDASEQLARTLVIEGSGHEMDLLERVGLAEQDALIAVADEEEMNLITCLYAKRLGVPRTIARIERPFYRPLMLTVGADAAVSARQATVNAILKHVRSGDIKAVARMRGISAEALELVPGSRAKIIDKPLSEVRFPRGALVGVVVRPNEVLVPDGQTVIHQNDHVVVFALEQAVRKVEKLFA